MRDIRSAKKIGLVLSGGSARGIVHLGVLQALAEQNISVSVISGASAGSIVGAFYAAGYSPVHTLDILQSINFFRLMRPAFSRMGLLKMEQTTALFQKYLPHNSFEYLKKNLIINATDLRAAETIYFSEGELIPAIQASCCIPGVFEPIKMNNRLMVDGGVLNNMPVEPLLECNCDFLIGSHCNPSASVGGNLTSVRSVVERSMLLAVNSSSSYRFSSLDILFDPPQLANYNLFDIGKAKEIFKIGYDFAKENLDNYQKQKLFYF
jgi:NTE family protein